MLDPSPPDFQPGAISRHQSIDEQNINRTDKISSNVSLGEVNEEVRDSYKSSLTDQCQRLLEDTDSEKWPVV